MKKIAAKDLLAFFEGLYHLLGAGLDLITALALQCQHHPKHEQSFKTVVTALHAGQSFSAALCQYFQIPRIIALYLRQSEYHGDCVLACQLSCTWLRDQLAWKRMLRQLSFYPLLLILTSIALMVVMLVFVLPEFASLYNALEIALPASTAWLIHLGVHADKLLILGILLVTVLTGLTILGKRFEGVRFIVEQSLSKFAGIRQIIQVHHEYQFALQLGTLLHSGCNLSQAIEVMRLGTDSLIFRQYLLQTQQAIARGNSLSQSLCHGLMQKKTFSALISLGEQTGRLDKLMLNLAEQHKQKSQIWQDQAKHIIQPLITLFLGGFLAFWILLLYYPMLQLGTNLG